MNKKEMLKIWQREAALGIRGAGFDPRGGRDINNLRGTGTLLDPASNAGDVAVYDYGDTYIIVGDARSGPWAVQVPKRDVRVASVTGSYAEQSRKKSEGQWRKELRKDGILDITAQDFFEMHPTYIRTTHEGRFYEDPRMGDEGPVILVDRKGNVIRTDDWD